jgi:hypothetical protein
VKLNRAGFDHAKRLIEMGRVIRDGADWSELPASAMAENEFIDRHGYEGYAEWHLGLDPLHGEHTKARYAFRYGRFKNIHRSSVISVKQRAGQYGFEDIAMAAAQLHDMIDGVQHRNSA